MKSEINFKILILTSLFFIISINFNLYSAIWSPIDAPKGGLTGQIVKFEGKLYCNTFTGIYENNLINDEWNKLPINIPQMSQITDIISDDNYLYATTLSGIVYKSDLSSNNWEEFFDSKKINTAITEINKVASNNTTVFVASNSGLYSTTNNGMSWELIPTLGVEFISKVAIAGNSLYAIANNNVFFYSTNLGQSWQQQLLMQDASVYELFIVKEDLYLASIINNFGFVVLKYNEQANEFNDYLPDIFNEYRIVAVSGDENRIILNTAKQLSNSVYEYRIVYSDDGAENWEIAFSQAYENHLDGQPFFSQGINYNANTIYLATTKSGIYNFDTASKEITSNNNNFHNLNISSLITNDNIFLAATKGVGIFSSTDYGNNWKHLENSPKASNNTFYIINKIIKHKDRYFIASSNGVYSSSDAGETWQSNSSEIFVTDIFSNGETLYAVGNIIYGQFMQSTDDGKTWATQALNNNPIALGLLVDGNIVCINTDAGIFRSLNKGETWQIVLGNEPINNLSSMVKSGDAYLASFNNLVYISNDKGANWNKVNQPITGLIYKIIAKDNLLFLSAENGVFLSIDHGLNWNEVSDGLPAGAVTTLSILQDTIYAAVFGDVIYKANFADFAQIQITNLPYTTACVGMSFAVSFSVSDDINFTENNKFIAQLSDSKGNFTSSSTEIGLVNSKEEGNIIVTIPESIPYGTNYRIRIVSTDPKITSVDNLKPITILEHNEVQITGENEVCGNTEHSYSVNSSQGYDYSWEIEGGEIIGNPLKADVIVKWYNEQIGTLKLFQKSIADCSDSTLISVNIVEVPPKPTITRIGNSIVSSNDYGNQWYYNGNILASDTSKVLEVSYDHEGNYTVISKNRLGCLSEMSDIFQYINEDKTILFTLDTISANTKEKVSLNIRLAKNTQFYNSKASSFEVTLEFNSTILYPTGDNKGTVIGSTRYLTLTFDTTYIREDIIYVVDLVAMLGEVEKTTITITNLKVNGAPYDNYLIRDGLFTLADVCYDDSGPRLLTSNQTSKIVNISPNPASNNIIVRTHIGMEGIAELYIQDQIGNKIIDITNENLKFGDYSYNVDTSKLAIGKYNVVLKINQYLSTYSIIIVR